MRFGDDAGGMSYKYNGQTYPRIHIEACVKTWQHIDVDEWVHLFVQTLDTLPEKWYSETELCRGTKTWSLLIEGFKLAFYFELEYPEIDDALEVISIELFDDYPLLELNQPDWAAQMKNAIECYNFATNEEENHRNVNRLESEGSRDDQGPSLELPKITEKVKIKKINIGTEEDLNFASIGYYWDDETVGHIADLLQEY